MGGEDRGEKGGEERDEKFEDEGSCRGRISHVR